MDFPIPAVWIVVGLLLVISEVLMTSIVAVFFGIAAILVGLLMWAGLLDTPSAQWFTFSVTSIALLVTTRHRLRQYLVGDVVETNDAHKSFKDYLGQRATAITDFAHGAGKVMLNGVSWTARAGDSSETISAGDPLWIVGHDGIELRVSKTEPVQH